MRSPFSSRRRVKGGRRCVKEMWVRKRGAPELTQHEHAHQNDCTVSAAGIKGTNDSQSNPGRFRCRELNKHG